MKGRLRRITMGCLLLVIAPPVALVLFVCIVALFNGRTGAPMDYSRSALLAQPPPPLTEPFTLKVVTWNIADAYLFTGNRPERMAGVAEKLIELDPDIAGIQESFIQKDRELLLELLKPSRLHHHAIYPAATVGNGLLILSAYPIREVYFHRFERSNPWYKLWEGDWWAGKGVGLARVALPCGALVDFYNTHAQAGRGHRTRYVEVRSVQMSGLARFMNETKSAAGLALVVGDFNTRIGRPDIQIAMDQAQLERLMTIDSAIDHIFGAADPRYRFETVETVEIKGAIQGNRPVFFLSRAPTPREIYGQFFGAGELTPLSDHSGYMSTIRISPVAPSESGL